jgi:hypothetical protein
VTPQAYPVTYAATSSEGSYTSPAQTNVAYPSFAAAYDNSGISDDNQPAAGSFDGGGLNFSAQGSRTGGRRPPSAAHPSPRPCRTSATARITALHVFAMAVSG